VELLAISCNHSSSTPFSSDQATHIANYSSEACFDEPEALDERVQARVSITRAMKALKNAGKIIHDERKLVLPEMKTA